MRFLREQEEFINIKTIEVSALWELKGSKILRSQCLSFPLLSPITVYSHFPDVI